MSIDSIVLGSITGLTYAILAVGLILIWGSNRFVNFAHGSLGALASVLFAKAVVDFGVPYWVALPLALAAAALMNGAVELGVVRRFFAAPRLVLVVASIALAQLFFFLSLLSDVQPDRTTLAQEGFPVAFDVTWRIGNVTLRGGHVSILVAVPLLAAALTVFLRYTAYGQAIRASADNPDAARLAGISVKRISTTVWMIAGVLAGATALLVAPLRASFAIETMGPSILIRALGAALVARMSSMPVAFGAAMVLGIAEAVLFAETLDGGLTDLMVFAAVLVTLLVRGRQLAQSLREGNQGTGIGAEVPRLAGRLASVARVQVLLGGVKWAALAAAVLVPLVPILNLNSSRTAFLLAITCGYAIVAVSLTVLTGWGGQVSLGQFALVGVGAFVVGRFETAPLPVAILLAGVLGAVAAVVIGLPALRIQGLFLAVTTLAFAVVATGWLFLQPGLVGEGSAVFLSRPDILGSERTVYYYSLALLLLALWLARNIRKSSLGRMIIAVRDNDGAARSAGISATWTRLVSFAISGFFAGVAGTIFAYGRQSFTSVDFPPATSLTVLLMVVVGGLGSLQGAVLGAVFMFGIPALFGSGDLVRLLTSSVGVLVVLLYLPGGLAGAVASARDALAERLARDELGLEPPPRTRPRLRELWRVAFANGSDGGPGGSTPVLRRANPRSDGGPGGSTPVLRRANPRSDGGPGGSTPVLRRANPRSDGGSR